jgi:hypothetical protein
MGIAGLPPVHAPYFQALLLKREAGGTTVPFTVNWAIFIVLE